MCIRSTAVVCEARDLCRKRIKTFKLTYLTAHTNIHIHAYMQTQTHTHTHTSHPYLYERAELVSNVH